ncbi:hypothetical protein [Methylobacterium sp. 22177]|uniref:hypothetical protein n=1 Tax=Methylobacterium sp. 22177 TaxID=3453885 RepID=UPI003F841343
MGGSIGSSTVTSFTFDERHTDDLAAIREWLGCSSARAVSKSLSLMRTLKNIKEDQAEVCLLLGDNNHVFHIRKGGGIINLQEEDEFSKDELISDVRILISKIESSLPALDTSNSLRNDIVSDIDQTKIEIGREKPRKKIIKVFLESLRDNLAKAAGGAVVAAIGALIAKYFGVF